MSTADLYQLFFYAQRLQLKHGLAEPPAAFIASPLPADDERESDAIGERWRRITWRAGGKQAGEARLLMVPLTALLRAVRTPRMPSILDEVWCPIAI